MSKGVIYYNTGSSCVVRLLISLISLRKYYSGPVTILSEGEESHRYCERIAQVCDAECKAWDCEVPPGEHRIHLAKTRYNEGSPYETTLAIDADTLVFGEIDSLLDQAKEADFCVGPLGDKSTKDEMITKRIREWSPWLPNDIKAAERFGPAINCGVIAFTRRAKIFTAWPQLALFGRRLFIPDEVCCQIILHRFPHRIVHRRWNRSCRYDNPTDEDTRIAHFHGRKHCRPGLPYHAHLWMHAFESAREANTAGLADWLPAGDRMLRQFLENSSTNMDGAG